MASTSESSRYMEVSLFVMAMVLLRINSDIYGGKNLFITDIAEILHSVRCKSTDPDIQVTVDDLEMLCNTKEIRHIFTKLGFE